MRKLVAYYSFTGNTRFIARSIADVIQADVLEVKPQKDIAPNRFAKLQGLKLVLKGESPSLADLAVDPAGYDVIFIGTPVWSYTVSPAIKAFLEKVNLQGKKVALFCCYGGYKGNTFKRMHELLPECEVIGEKEFRDPITGEGAKADEARRWALSVTKRFFV
jgi:flavodoxin